MNIESPARRGAERRLFSAALRLRPDIFPLLNRQAFDDLLARNSTDPIGSILQVLSPGPDPALDSDIYFQRQVEIVCDPVFAATQQHIQSVAALLDSTLDLQRRESPLTL